MPIMKIDFSMDDISHEHQIAYVTVKVSKKYCCKVKIVTPEFVDWTIEDNSLKYFNCPEPVIIVKTLSFENIVDAIRNLEDYNKGYWLKLYHFAPMITTHIFEELLEIEKTSVIKD